MKDFTLTFGIQEMVGGEIVDTSKAADITGWVNLILYYTCKKFRNFTSITPLIIIPAITDYLYLPLWMCSGSSIGIIPCRQDRKEEDNSHRVLLIRSGINITDSSKFHRYSLCWQVHWWVGHWSYVCCGSSLYF